MTNNLEMTNPLQLNNINRTLHCINKIQKLRERRIARNIYNTIICIFGLFLIGHLSSHYGDSPANILVTGATVAGVLIYAILRYDKTNKQTETEIASLEEEYLQPLTKIPNYGTVTDYLGKEYAVTDVKIDPVTSRETYTLSLIETYEEYPSLHPIDLLFFLYQSKPIHIT